MKLTDVQLKEVAVWFSGGASVAEIQKKVEETFGVSLTYLDARLLVADLPQPPEPEPVKAESAPVKSDEDVPTHEISDADGLPAEADMPGADGTMPAEDADSSLTVSVDALMIPGTMASGDVTFSDGKVGKWYLDQSGRLGLGGDLPEGYRPSPADAALFQARLMEALRAKGMM